MEKKDKKENILRIIVGLGGALASFFLLQILSAYLTGHSPTFIQGIGVLIGINCILITIYLHRHREREQELDEILQAINTKTEFVVFASHQLRTPITTIRWEAETLLKKKGLAKDVAKVLEEIETKAKRLSDLVNALLNMVKLDTGKMVGEPEKTDLVALTKDVVQELQSLMAAKHLSFKAKYESGEFLITTHPKLMKIALNNILENAIQYSKKNGAIEVAIEEGKENIKIEVKDTGIGIPKDDLEHIFNKLYRASNAIKYVPEGNGLGLYMVKAIVDSMDGKVEIDSEEETGTVVRILLPLQLRTCD